MERATAKLSLISQVIHIHVQRRRMPSMAGMSRGERRAHADQDDREVRCMRAGVVRDGRESRGRARRAESVGNSKASAISL